MVGVGRRMMNDDLDRENFHALSLQQALLGMISSNVRWIYMTSTSGSLHIGCVLEHESEADREEMDDLLTEMEVLLIPPYEVDDISVDVTVSTEPLFLGRTDVRNIYRRKED